MDILILKKEDISKVFTMKDAIDAVKESLVYGLEESSKLPLRSNIHIKKYEGDSLYMPAYVEKSEALGVKIVSTYPNNKKKGKITVPASMILLDASTGEVKSILDGTYLTQLRTGALSGAATDILSRPDSKKFVLFGTGGQARGQLEAILNVRKIEELIIFGGSNLEKTQSFVREMREEFSDKYEVDILEGKDRDRDILDADIITTVTPSRSPVFNSEYVKEGAHINGVGSYRPDMVEIAEDLVAKSSVYVDTLEGVLSEAGDIIGPLKKGLIKKSDIKGELGQVICGDLIGRSDIKEISLFKSVGTALADVVTGQKIYEKARKENVGKMINM